MPQHSESLLTEILLLLQNLNSNVHDFSVRLERVDGDVGALGKKFDDFIESAIPTHIAENHVKDHERMRKSNFMKRLFKKLGND